MVVSILGCGWYGKALTRSLIQKGITVKGSSTSDEKLKQLSSKGIIPYSVQFDADSENFDSSFFECDVLIISIPPKFRKGETAGYLPKIERIIKTILEYHVSKVIYISSTGVYGDHNNEVNELSDPNPDTESGSILLEAEKLFQKETDFKTTIIRFGGLVGPGRHPGRFFAGKKDIPNGLAPVNLIHQQDCVGISEAIIERDAFGYLFNACSSDHPTRADFYGRTALEAGLQAPEFINELNNWKIVDSINLKSILNYEFKVPHWTDNLFDEQ
ncbi:SDR family oxidoreductase [Mucilaginibacter sp. McL0603]|uniref:SDR family oxidoreductase n=1 Tax=Mucilaginibacter sp. McL0603 TaxID=3415670 RepID=UPI003CF22F95